MARAYGTDLRVRVIEAINGSLSTRAAAARFAIGIATTGAWHLCWRKTGEVKPGRLGNPSGSKLDAQEDFILGLIAEQKDIALHEIAAWLAAQRGLAVQPSTVWYFLDRRGMTFKNRRRTPPNKSARTSPPRAKPGAKANPPSIPHG
jgi:transposase